jgi:hypothetical protein
VADSAGEVTLIGGFLSVFFGVSSCTKPALAPGHHVLPQPGEPAGARIMQVGPARGQSFEGDALQCGRIVNPRLGAGPLGLTPTALA